MKERQEYNCSAILVQDTASRFEQAYDDKH